MSIKNHIDLFPHKTEKRPIDEATNMLQIFGISGDFQNIFPTRSSPISLCYHLR